MDQRPPHGPIPGDEPPVGLMSIDPSGRILDASPALLRFLGSPCLEATLRINVLSYLPLVQAGLAADFRRALSDGEVVSADRVYTSKWGKALHARVTVLPVVDAAGAVARALVLVEDRSASFRAEALLRTQRDLGVALASASSLESALDSVLDAALAVEGIDCGGVYLFEDGALVLRSHRRLSPDFVERTRRCPPEDPRTRLVQAGSPIFRKWEELGPPADATVARERLRALAVLPVRDGLQVVGALNAASHTEDEVTEPARDALESIASQAGSVIGRLRVQDELREREAFLALLSSITLRTLQAADIDGWLGPLTDEVAGLFSCDACFVTGWSGEGRPPVPLAASGRRTPEYRSIAPLPGEPTITGAVLETGRPVVVEDVGSSAALSPRLARLFPYRSALGLPLLARGERLGAIVLAWDLPHRFTPRELATAEQAAMHLSLALFRSGFASTPLRAAEG